MHLHLYNGYLIAGYYDEQVIYIPIYVAALLSFNEAAAIAKAQISRPILNHNI